MPNSMSTISNYRNFNNNISSVQNNIAKTPNIIDGRIENYAELSADRKVEEFINVKTSLKSVNDYIKNNDIIEGRLFNMDQALDQII